MADDLYGPYQIKPRFPRIPADSSRASLTPPGKSGESREADFDRVDDEENREYGGNNLKFNSGAGGEGGISRVGDDLPAAIN